MPNKTIILKKIINGPMNQTNRIVPLGNGLEAIPLEHSRGFKIELRDKPWETPKALRADFPSLTEAREAVSKYQKGKLNPTRLGEGFSLIQKQ
jgi:hypothetical protein